MTWSAIVLVLIGRNVPGPTWSVKFTHPMPLAAKSLRSFSVKCSPAVGAATEPGLAAKTV
jgi:hypothetical protein